MNWSITLPAEREAFTSLKDWLVQIAAEIASTEKARKQLLISVDEVFTNIVSYGYPHGGGNVLVTADFSQDDRVLKLMVVDQGVAFNPLDTPPPNPNASLMERKMGGLGIMMVKKMMDQVEYKREGDKNILTMSKHLDPGPAK